MLDDLDPVDPDAPFVGHRLHLRLQLRVDPFALAQRVVQTHAAENGAKGRPGQLVDGDEVVAHAEEGELGIDHLAEDGGVHADGDVVARDHFLLVTRSRCLSDVDGGHGVDQWHQEGHARLPDGMELPEPLHDANVSLLDDIDCPGHQHEDEEQ